MKAVPWLTVDFRSALYALPEYYPCTPSLKINLTLPLDAPPEAGSEQILIALVFSRNSFQRRPDGSSLWDKHVAFLKAAQQPVLNDPTTGFHEDSNSPLMRATCMPDTLH